MSPVGSNQATCGRFKLGHPWICESRVSWRVFNLCLLGCSAFLEAMAPPLHGDDLCMVQKAVEYGSGGGQDEPVRSALYFTAISPMVFMP
jgi:hypothetical protein